MPIRKQIYGAKWWKFDFHTHTPASNDFGKGDLAQKDLSPEDWLLAFMKAEIDCVAVTDHNSGEWIDLLKSSLEKLKNESHKEYRELYIFPGVEISVNSNCHVLAIFDLNAGTKEITALLGSIGFNSNDFGTSDSVTSDSIEIVLEKIIKSGAIAIPAHTDKVCGLFERTNGRTLAQALKTDGLLAIEVVDQAFVKPTLYSQMGINLTEVVGTDAHTTTQVGTNFTWVKMHSPSLNALRLALHDGEDGVIRKEDAVNNPNTITNRYFIRSISVDKAYKAGRSAPMTVKFSPWLSSIIGGRGCGKSSLINFLRLSLCRHADMPEQVQKDFDSFKRVGSREGIGMLTSDTKICVEINKDGSLYAVTWKCNGSLFELQKWIEDKNDWSEPTQITNVTDLFPVQVFSQKELYGLTDDPSKLLDIIDSQFDKDAWKARKEELMTKWLSGRFEERDIRKQLAEETNIRAQKKSIEDRIKLYESSDYRETLFQFNTYTSIERFFSDASTSMEAFISSALDLNGKIPALTPNENVASTLDDQSQVFLEKVREKLQIARTKLIELIDVLSEYQGKTFQQVQQLPWKDQFEKIKLAYASIIDKTKEHGNETYETLVQKQHVLNEKLNTINLNSKKLTYLQQHNNELYKEIIEHENRLRAFRQTVINRWKSVSDPENPFLIVELNPMSNLDDANKTLRDLLRKPGDEFSRYIYQVNAFNGAKEGFLAELEAEPIQSRWQKREEIIRRLLSATEAEPNGFDRRLIKHIQALRLNTPEDIDRLLIWVPEDEIVLQFAKDGKAQDIQAGSAGERVAGMLGLLLALNDVPLIIDQPEDDLDTRLISNFVVPTFQKLKRNRQLILVTHNPNIAVNASSDNIVYMNFSSGQIVVAGNDALQDQSIRRAVCEVMEGGREALNRRYFRISKALNN